MRIPRLRVKTPWIRTADRLPEKTGQYFIAERRQDGSFYKTAVYYSAKHQQFNNFDGQEYDHRKPGDAFYDVAYWMPFPPVPEEVE